MSKLKYSLTTRFALLTALGIAALFAAGHASAGTQMPPWKWQQLYGGSSNGAAAQVVDNGNGDGNGNGNGDNQETPDYTDNGNNGGGDNGTPGNGSPAAAPSPSAVAGGLAMFGLLAGRRRRQAQED